MILDKIWSGHSSGLPKEADPFFWYPSSMRITKSTAGKNVSEETAFTVSTFYACVRNLAEDVATLPLCVYKDLDGIGRERDTSHHVYKLLKQKPNPMMTAWTFRSAITTNVVTWGNGYAEIVRDQRGRPQQLWLIHPSRVRIELTDNGDDVIYRVQGTLNGKHVEVPLESKNVIHLKGLTTTGIEGISIIQAAAESLGIALAEQEFTGSFLDNGASVTGVLTHPKRMNNEALNRLRESWATAFKGSCNAGKPAILEEGMEWKQMSIPQRDAQFLEQRSFSVNDVCRWFRMPPHKVQHLENATYSNIESQDRQYVNDTLMPWLARYEEEFTQKLFSPQELNRGMFIAFKVEGRLRGDMQARAQFYKEMAFNGFMNANEVREMENLNPRGPDGDVFFMQSAMIPVEQLINPPEEKEPEPEPEPEEEEESAPPEEEPEAVADNEAVAIILRSAVSRVVRKTEKATCGKERDEAWLGDFYHKQLLYMAQEVKPISEAFNIRFGNVENMTREHLHDVDALTDLLLKNAEYKK